MVKVVLTGSLGNIGKPLTEILVKSNHSVSVITRNADKTTEIKGLGAAALVGSVEDSAFLSAAFAGAEIAYIMVPNKLSEPDNNAYSRKVAEIAVDAIRSAGVKKVILLSGQGADLSSGTGFILGCYHAEQVLGTLEGIALTIIRPGYFYYNLLEYVPLIKHEGYLAANYGGADRLDLVHPVDIADAIAEEVQDLADSTTDVGTKVRYVVSDTRTADEIAAVLGAAIAKPDLTWALCSDEEAHQGLVQSGMPEAAAAQATEMGAAYHSGIVYGHYDSLPSTKRGRITLEEYVRQEFVAAYNA